MKNWTEESRSMRFSFIHDRVFNLMTRLIRNRKLWMSSIKFRVHLSSDQIHIWTNHAFIYPIHSFIIHAFICIYSMTVWYQKLFNQYWCIQRGSKLICMQCAYKMQALSIFYIALKFCKYLQQEHWLPISKAGKLIAQIFNFNSFLKNKFPTSRYENWLWEKFTYELLWFLKFQHFRKLL